MFAWHEHLNVVRFAHNTYFDKEERKKTEKKKKRKAFFQADMAFCQVFGVFNEPYKNYKKINKKNGKTVGA